MADFGEAKPGLRIVAITSSRSLVLSDSFRFLVNSGATAATLTIPQDTFKAGQRIEFYTRTGATGSITPSAGAGVTLAGGKTLAAGKGAFLHFFTANDCELIGG